jgi:hypothetical protein
MWRDDWLVTVYLPSDGSHPGSREISEVVGQLGGGVVRDAVVRYDGTEGELYNLADDPLQWHNLWNDPSAQAMKSDLVADLMDNLPPKRDPLLPVEAPT